VVSDFRTRDMAAGGQGAPLVPWVDRALFSAPGRRRALQNIGGMGNVTWLPARGEEAGLLAFDTGPGNVLIDAAVELATDGQETFDRDGHWARSGAVQHELLRELLQHPFYAAPPPKSTGREAFGKAMVRDLAARHGAGGRMAWPDFIATLTALTARTIGEAYRTWLLPRGLDEVFITGGGARNPVLLEMIRGELVFLSVRTGRGFRGARLGPCARCALQRAQCHRRPGASRAGLVHAGTVIAGLTRNSGCSRRYPLPVCASLARCSSNSFSRVFAVIAAARMNSARASS
jgi:anhydro-N-acetylmuramic acid kinase